MVEVMEGRSGPAGPVLVTTNLWTNCPQVRPADLRGQRWQLLQRGDRRTEVVQLDDSRQQPAAAVSRCRLIAQPAQTSLAADKRGQVRWWTGSHNSEAVGRRGGFQVASSGTDFSIFPRQHYGAGDTGSAAPRRRPGRRWRR